MNLIVWLLSGGLLGAVTAMLFAPSEFYLTGDLCAALIGSLLGGYLAVYFRPERSSGDLNPKKFSPGALAWAVFLSVLFLSLFKIFFH